MLYVAIVIGGVYGYYRLSKKKDDSGMNEYCKLECKGWKSHN